jgi:hypothetical protein
VVWTDATRHMRIFLLSPFRNAYLFRGAVLWVCIRFAFHWAEVVEVGLVVSAGILLTIGTAVYLDARRRDEDIFLANLGVPGGWIGVAALPIPLLLEILIP